MNQWGASLKVCKIGTRRLLPASAGVQSTSRCLAPASVVTTSHRVLKSATVDPSIHVCDNLPYGPPVFCTIFALSPPRIIVAFYTFYISPTHTSLTFDTSARRQCRLLTVSKSLPSQSSPRIELTVLFPPPPPPHSTLVRFLHAHFQKTRYNAQYVVVHHHTVITISIIFQDAYAATIELCLCGRRPNHQRRPKVRCPRRFRPRCGQRRMVSILHTEHLSTLYCTWDLDPDQYHLSSCCGVEGQEGEKRKEEGQHTSSSICSLRVAETRDGRDRFKHLPARPDQRQNTSRPFPLPSIPLHHILLHPDP